MRTHSALHVLCGTVFRDYGALVTGGDMDPLKGRMDFEFASMRGELVREIETAVNREIALGYDIRVNILPREEAFEIPDSSVRRSTCCRRASSSSAPSRSWVLICRLTAAPMLSTPARSVLSASLTTRVRVPSISGSTSRWFRDARAKT
jgi:hypothetical protein